MGKNKHKGAHTPAGVVAATPANSVQAPAAVQGGAVVPGVLQVKPGANLRGARAAWYAVLLQYDGQPVATWLQHCAANPPSMPQKGALAGKGEPPKGWLGWFVRNGWATVVVPAATPQAEA